MSELNQWFNKTFDPKKDPIDYIQQQEVGNTTASSSIHKTYVTQSTSTVPDNTAYKDMRLERYINSTIYIKDYVELTEGLFEVNVHPVVVIDESKYYLYYTFCDHLCRIHKDLIHKEWSLIADELDTNKI